ncbi:conserved hypothetical protein [Ricinus communis]|uniref:Uncharacterized protein n=1 Tax=Ricinus communis TaxID=3988 RepID=B9SYX6_RICCO|nr:conserved hypothetical protein [Ricinus communis]
MSCFSPKNKLSIPYNKKPWEPFISTFQKKLNRLLKPKPFNRITNPKHHHRKHYHHHHSQQCQPARSSADNNDRGHGLEDDDRDHEDTKNTESTSLQLNGVDASAQEFIV